MSFLVAKCAFKLITRKKRMKPNSKEEDSPKATANIRKLKALVAEQFPKDSPLRIILAERDVLSAQEFLAKMETYLNLLRVAK